MKLALAETLESQLGHWEFIFSVGDTATDGAAAGCWVGITGAGMVGGWSKVG